MRQFILAFLFIAFVNAADDALLQTKDGPKSSADLVKEAAPQAASEGDVPTIDKIPLGAAVGTTVVKDEDKAAAVEADVAKAEAAEEKDKSKSAESKESKEEQKEGDGEKKVVVNEAVPKETVAVAKKKPGEETEVATATKVDVKPVVKEARVKRQEPIDKIPLGAAVGTTVVKDDPKAGEVKEDKAGDKSKSSESKEEKEEAVETEKVKLSKVPTEEIAVAHKKEGDDEVEIATATKAAIVAEKVEEKSRARRFV